MFKPSVTVIPFASVSLLLIILIWKFDLFCFVETKATIGVKLKLPYVEPPSGLTLSPY